MWKISIKKLIVRRFGVFSMLQNNVFYLFNALILVFLCNSYAYAETQFFEDFNGGAVDESIWAYPTGDASFNGRTQMRLSYPSVSNGLLHLQLDTYNPTANPVGQFFLRVGNSVTQKRRTRYRFDCGDTRPHGHTG